ncbi:alpha/beta fold hydrolase [Streptosporangium sp. NPDC000396]|uniref:alpha/beta fold hydrolase n=1 Tax=Streptosporangium sp. NPDC000396 TaxID=3366185 RepID=UPI0036A5E9F2
MRFPYAEVQFDSTGSVHDQDEQRHAVETIAAAGVTDVLVLAHGWNNDIPAARAFYRQLTDNLAEVRPTVPAAANVRLAVVGVLWPAIRWADPGMIAGGGAAVADPESVLRVEIREKVSDPGTADRLDALLPELETSPQARAEFLGLLRSLIPRGTDDEDGPPPALMEGDAEDVFETAGRPNLIFGGPERAGGATALGGGPASEGGPEGEGGMAGLGFPRPLLQAARNLLNTTTYFTMKERAGQVGSIGVAGLLDAVRTRAPGVRRHLAGHSFGARLVSAAALRHAPVHSITLLQGAFSHHGFATDYDGAGHRGFFRPVLDAGRLTGPLVVTHTARDLAVGVAYAIVSRLAGQRAAGLPGGPDDPYGGIGRNGAMKTSQVTRPPERLLPVGDGYAFTGGRVYNLLSDSFITSHSDVAGREVANALLHAICSP